MRPRLGPRAAERVLLVLLALAPLPALELAARLLPADPLERAQPLLRPDARLGWRQREDWTGEFYGERVRLDPRGLRLPAGEGPLVLGPSSAFGWGVAEDKTYAALLGGRNAGEIGYSSAQGLRLFKEDLAALKPKFVVLAYGVNDVDRFRFMEYGTGDVLRRSALWRRVERGARAARFHLSCELPQTALRVPPAAFSTNLGELAAEARRRGAAPVFLTSAFKYRESEADARRCDEKYAEAGRLAKDGRCAEARAAFLAARALEPARLARDLRAYNALVRALAKKEKAALVDAETLLGPEDLLDPVHPSAAGHAKLAGALRAKMVEPSHARR